ncbi:MAG: FtsX-like permease family protein, partial [Verrucomicrobiota bacterium]
YLYTRLALAGMSGVWSDAAAGIEFVYQLSPTSLLAAFFITVSVALVVAWIAARRIGAVQPSALIGGTGNPLAGGTAFWKKKRLRWDWIIFILGLLGGIGSLLAPKTPGTIAEQGLFFGAGFWLVAAGVAAASIILRRTLRPGRGLPSISVLGRQQAARRRGRSLAVIGLMAAGVFMVSAINSFRLDGSRGADRRGSGTGGFAYVGEATLPIYEDLNTVGGREKYGLDSVPSGFEVVSFRASNGEDASCLNLNRAQRPRLLGVDPDRLAELGAFTFTQNSDSQKEGWSGLDLTPTRTDPAVPVIAGIIDQSTAIYALGISSVGSRLQYETVSGAAFEVEIVGFLDTSILQGSVIISEENFIEQFPDSGGYQLLLIDGSDATPSGELDSTANALSRMFAARGLELRPASDKLNEFNAVQNTYLSIFSTLGGLGILLGTIGLAIVVGRNVLERRGELGVMQAVGFDRGQLGRLILSEHWFLHVSGVLLGLGAALVAVLPRLGAGMSPGTWGLLLGINAAVLAGGLVFCWLASRWTTQGNLTEAIRTE